MCLVFLQRMGMEPVLDSAQMCVIALSVDGRILEVKK